MSIQTSHFTVASAMVLLATIFISPFAYAKCGCPSDGGDKPSAVTGLGESMPKASNLSRDPEWQVYEFERDGIRYLQINDHTSRARAAIGQIGTTAWVLPIGRDADRVSIQANASAAIAGRVVYWDDKVEVVHSRQSNQDLWIVSPTETAR
jgi:hypothetical protein